MNALKATIIAASRNNSTNGSELSSPKDAPIPPPESAETISVLVVERAAQLKPLQQDLQAQGYQVSGACKSIEALRILKETVPKLIILDVSLGSLNDWHLLKAIRDLSDAPILGRVDLNNITGIGEGLKLGIDDYVSRSVDLSELNVRIRVALVHAQRRRQPILPKERRSGVDRRKMPLGRRRTDQQKVLFGESVVCLTAGPFKIDDRHKTVTVEGKERWLSPKEYTLLKLLVAVPGRVVSNEQIIAALWPRSSRATNSDVQQYVHLLRTKVEKNPRQPLWIKTVKGFGYRLASTDPQ